MTARKPLVGIVACRKEIAPHMFHAVGEKYISAVASAAGALPLLVPVLGRSLPLAQLLDELDGLFFTGSPSNVEPHHYGGASSDADTAHDPHRDATTLPLIIEAVRSAVPVLAVCRGCQEMNVAFGGSLHQKVHDVAGMRDHREDEHDPLDVQYGPAHEVRLADGGMLARLAGGAASVEVNSLHSQGIDRLGTDLVVEATAPDGLIEAFRVQDAPAFALAVQWHPEWQVMRNSFSRAIFAAFGDACRSRLNKKNLHGLDSAVV